MIEATDRHFAAEAAAARSPTLDRGRPVPLTHAQRQERYRARRRGELAPYPWISVDELAGQRTPEGCLEWMRDRGGSQGYGRIKIGGRLLYVHRLALEAKLGRPIADGMFACHTCDNPPCFEPAHLYEGRPAENTSDMIRRHRAGWQG